MLVVDLDGTALTGRNTLRDDDREAALELKRRGVHVTIATGRLLAGTRWVADALEVEGSVAVMNGSSRFDVRTNTVTHADAFTPADQSTVSEVFEQHDLPGFLYGLERIHVHRAHLRYAPYLRIWTPDLVEHEGAAWHDVSGTLSIGGIGERDAIESAGKVLAENLPHVRVKYFDTFEGERFIELRTGLQDKGTALHALAAERGLTAQEVVAVGDWWNDLPMLKVAGHSYAMGGATEPVVAAAHHQLQATLREGGAIVELARRVWDV
jgi:Cof subfamily protein (haloacid dehalogenase superfamily)